MTSAAQDVWKWLWLDARAPQRAAAPLAADDDLDFLQAPEEQPLATEPLANLPRTNPRWDQALALAGQHPHLPANWTTFAQDPRWPHVDSPAAWLACQWWQSAEDPLAVRGAAHGPVSALLRRAVRCGDADLALAAARSIARLQVEEAQEDVALRLMDLSSLDHVQQTALLDVLDALGDGRCVRAMEAVLAAVGPQLPDHHAWRARHIVQRIRRGGRR